MLKESLARMKSNNKKSELEKWWWFEYNQENHVNNTLDDEHEKNGKLTSLPVVRIKNCINGFTIDSKIISTRFVEYYFVSSAIDFISNDKNILSCLRLSFTG